MSLAPQRLRENETVRRSRVTEPQMEPQVLPRKRITKGEKVLWGLGVITVFILCITIVSNATALYNETKQVSQLQTKIETISSTNTGLRTQISQLSAPERIINYAKDKLGMTLDVKNVKVVK
ncbi:cell division protein FtsL [Pullulanibacillus sp. KACC 23026]|uniref:cell division protein FtsL n=1 Tax=Pullulanibacillus sp. KACC 23026 TaxID=3028315 RepID=UPI0023B175A3|nr:cell division protein FtsL [Pullulanibacillus sp. KACC 23026]WEG11668.1 cell division protein FtsL [Pullulanibacillus sp. KACC 23026]